MKFELPYPPSLNSYYRHARSMVLISAEGRKYRALIKALLIGRFVPVKGNVSFKVDVYPPDARRRDLDNLFKCMFDSLTHAGIWEDDSQVKRINAEMRDPIQGGLVYVEIEEIKK